MRRMLTGLVTAGIVAVALVAARSSAVETTDDEVKNPYIGQQEAIEEGKQIYRGKCILCHRHSGGRGPNLFKSKLTDQQFLKVVTKGREGTLMPAFGYKISPDDVWKVHAFVKSRDRY